MGSTWPQPHASSNSWPAVSRAPSAGELAPQAHAAFNVWFVQEVLAHDAFLTRYLSRRWRTPTEIADIKQDIYTRLLVAFRDRRPESMRKFLIAAAHNKMSDYARASKRRREEPIEQLVEGLPSRDDSCPLAQACVAQDARRVWHAFKAIPARSREVLWRRRINDQPLRSIATELSISPHTVEQHVRKGLGILSHELRSQQGEHAKPRRDSR